MPPLVLFHTSPVLIEKIARHSPYSPFDGCFFFSGDVYTMGPGDPYVYTVALKPDDVIDVAYLDDWSYAKVDEGAGEAALAQALREIEDEVGVDEDSAARLLTDETDVFAEATWDPGSLSYEADGEALGELSWGVQRIQCKTAKRMGYVAVQAEDEQGTVWIADMVGRRVNNAPAREPIPERQWKTLRLLRAPGGAALGDLWELAHDLYAPEGRSPPSRARQMD